MKTRMKQALMDADIQAFIDSELAPQDMQGMAELLRRNEACRRRYEQLLRQKKLLQFLYGQGVCH